MSVLIANSYHRRAAGLLRLVFRDGLPRLQRDIFLDILSCYTLAITSLASKNQRAKPDNPLI